MPLKVRSKRPMGAPKWPVLDLKYNYAPAKSRNGGQVKKPTSSQETALFLLRGLAALRLPYFACRALLPPMMNSLQISAALCAAIPLLRSARADKIGALTVMIEHTRATSLGKPYTSMHRLVK